MVEKWSKMRVTPVNRPLTGALFPFRYSFPGILTKNTRLLFCYVLRNNYLCNTMIERYIGRLFEAKVNLKSYNYENSY